MYIKIKKRLYETYLRIRCWIDCEPYLDEIRRGKSEGDKFSEKIIREIKNVMRSEKFSYETGKVLLPTNYIVLISEADDAEWVGIKREGLRKKLLTRVGNEIRPVLSQATLMPHNYNISIKESKELQRGEIKIIPQWEEKEPTVQICVNGNYYSQKPEIKRHRQDRTADFQTIFTENSVDEEITVFNSNSKKIFCIEVWRYGVCQNVIPVYRSEITVGRGSPSIVVDVPLHGDAGISRLHAKLQQHENGQYTLSVSGKKPIIAANGQTVHAGHSIPIFTGEPVQIGSYTLCIKN